MEDPGPNVLEQQIETNRLLALLIAGGGAASPSDPGLAGGARGQWPTLFSWIGGTKQPFACTTNCAGGVSVETDDEKHLSHDSAILISTPGPGGVVGTWTSLQMSIPMGPSLAVRIQLAWMFSGWPWTQDLVVEFEYSNSVNKLEGAIRLKGGLGELYYNNSVGADVLLAAKLFDNNEVSWTKADMVLNFAEAKYHWVAANAHGYDLTAQALKSSVSAEPRRLQLKLTAYNGSTEAPIMTYLDEILVTEHLYMGSV